MTNLDWLEWEYISSINFRITQHGNCPNEIDNISITRNSDLKLIAIGQGNLNLSINNLFNLQREGLQPGELIPTKETIGKTEFGEIVCITNSIIKNSTQKIIGVESPVLFIDIEVNEFSWYIDNYQEDENIDRHIEWIVNFSMNQYFTKSTTRIFESNLIIERTNYNRTINRKTEAGYNISYDHFCCHFLLEDKTWKLIIGKIPESIAPASCKPAFIEFLDLHNNLPTEDIKSKLLIALSFLFGRQLVSVGSTSLNQHGDRLSFTTKSVDLLGVNDSYEQPDLFPAPICVMDENELLKIDEDKISFMLTPTINFIKEFNVEQSFYLVWLGQASPINVKASHFGAAIESLRERYCSLRKKHLPDNIWNSIKCNLITAFDESTRDLQNKLNEDTDNVETIKKILKNQINNLNNKSSNMKYKEFFDLISLPIGKVEEKALRERNPSAHGSSISQNDFDKVINRTDALYTLFNRIVLKITKASDFYIDYSTYGFPIRNIDDPLGGPLGDGSPI